MAIINVPDLTKRRRQIVLGVVAGDAVVGVSDFVWKNLSGSTVRVLEFGAEVLPDNGPQGDDLSFDVLDSSDLSSLLPAEKLTIADGSYSGTVVPTTNTIADDGALRVQTLSTGTPPNQGSDVSVFMVYELI